MTEFIEVSGKGSHFLALRKDGTVWSWGNNKYGQLGYMTEKMFSNSPQKIPKLKNIINIAAAMGHSLALDNKGQVWAFGANDGMQLGLDVVDENKHIDPVVTYVNHDAVRVIADGGQSALLTNNGDVFFWGGELFSQRRNINTTPKKFTFSKPIVDLAMSDALYVLTNDGFVLSQSGHNSSGQLGQGDYKDYPYPVQVKNIGRIISVAAKISSGIALDEKGRIWQWGDSLRFKSIPTLKISREPLPIKIAEFPNANSIAVGSANSVLLNDGNVFFWGIDEGRRGTNKPNFEQNSVQDWSVPEKSMWTWK